VDAEARFVAQGHYLVAHSEPTAVRVDHIGAEVSCGLETDASEVVQGVDVAVGHRDHQDVCSLGAGVVPVLDEVSAGVVERVAW
jgi:hypothetical protein